MWFVGIYREFQILYYLRAISRQRVSAVLQPGDVWLVENSPKSHAESQAILLTCQLRGWVEPMFDDPVPHGQLTPEGKLPSGALFQSSEPCYRITDSGWNAIHRQHQLGLLAVLVAIASYFG